MSDAEHSNAGPLHDSVALVTGAGSGIGRAVARRLAAAGAKVGVLGRTEAKLAIVSDEIAAAGGQVVTLAADVRDRAQVEKAAASLVTAFGQINILVNNAGLGMSAPFGKTSLELWENMLAANLTSVFLVTQAVLPHLLAAGGGRIVSIASIAGLKGYPYISAYTAAKHGVVGLTRALAVELAGKNITVNAVCPGYVDTPMTQATIRNIVEKTGRTSQEARSTLEAYSPQHRLLDPDEIAATVAYLCSPDARGINGQAIPICGGELAL